jgi:AraC-like DNA-binding protein/mannose-6-phosphate isomerase-like protein (cupin superfamily)
MIYGEHQLKTDSGVCLKLFHSTVESGRRVYREHHHTQLEIGMIMSGSGTYTLSNKAYFFKKGDIFVFSSNEIHCITCIEKATKLDLINIHFEPRYLWSQTNGFNNVGLSEVFFDRSDKFENRINRSNTSTVEIRDLILKIEREFIQKKLQYETMIKMHLCHILVLLSRNYGYINANHTNTGQTRILAHLEKALKYMDENLEKKITLDELAQIATMNRSYFCCVFKKYNGISAWDYITIKRIERAIIYLETTNLTKIEIATRCGFPNTANFYHAFKKVTGKIPSVYCR